MFPTLCPGNTFQNRQHFNNIFAFTDLDASDTQDTHVTPHTPVVGGGAHLWMLSVVSGSDHFHAEGYEEGKCLTNL